MIRTLLQRKVGALSVLVVLMSGVPAVTTFLLATRFSIERVFVVAMVPLAINGVLGLVITYFATTGSNASGRPSGPATNAE